MGSRPKIYKIKSTEILVIERGCEMMVIPSQPQGNLLFELLNEYGEGTGSMVSVSPDDLEIVC
jgi:hypothetical protein